MPIPPHVYAAVGKALFDAASRQVDEPWEQDAVLDWLEDWVADTATKWDDHLLLPVFRAARVFLKIEETNPRYADNKKLARLNQGLREVIDTPLDLTKP